MEQYLDARYWNGLLKMGLSRFFILRVLYSNPAHGYAIARQIADLTRGCCSPSEAAIYPVLKEFVQGGYVTFEKTKVSGRERKVYTLTDKGRQAYEVAVEAWRETTKALSLAHAEQRIKGGSVPDAAIGEDPRDAIIAWNQSFAQT